MKDRQTPADGLQQRIFFVSTLLHLLAMPGTVFLRSGFGFSYLSPKSIFLALAWTQVLFAVYVRLEPGKWLSYRAIVIFGCSAALAYTVHLLIAFARELNKAGAHDYFSGRSHFFRIPGLSQLKEEPRAELMVHLWLEPFVLLVAAIAAKAMTDSSALPVWLMVTALSVWMKEFINHWHRIRHSKKHEDIFSDAAESIEPTSNDAALPQAGGRRKRSPRNPSAEQPSP